MSDEDPRASQQIKTEGGAYVEGRVDTRGGDFVSRDKVTHVYTSKEQERDRRDLLVLLNRVKDFWIEGVLEESVHAAALIELGMEERAEAVDHPWEMVLEALDQEKSRTLPPGTRIVDVFSEMAHNLLILGAPGSGKTITLLELARDTIAGAESDPKKPIPVVFNLSSWRRGQSLTDWLVEELNVKYQIPKKVGRKWVDASDLLLLLDGLDEVKMGERYACVEAINRFRQEHGLTDFVVCSRTEEYKALAARLKLEGAILLQPLTSEQIDDYLAAAGSKLAALRIALQTDFGLQDLIRSPLMLTIMSLAYQDMPVEALGRHALDTMEDRRDNLFDTYIERMLKRRGKASQIYTPEQTVRWLTWLAQKMSQHDQTIFLIEQLQPSWLSTRQQRWFYALGSRLIGGLGIGLSVGLVEGPRGGSIGGLIGLSVGIIVALRFERRGGNIEGQRISTLWRSAINVLGVMLVGGLSCWLIVGLIGELIVGLSGGMIGGLSVVLIFGLRSSRQSITNDIQTAETLTLSWRGVLKGAGIGLIIGLIGGL
ncbi:MAG: NACHT domain-containing protein, partial [Chloroflexi bacterium]|nr:NACHT domain-containing protein [Chloroflexota bacterium]